MVTRYTSALNGVAVNPALPASLLPRLLAFDGRGEVPPFQALHRPGLPKSAVEAVRAHPIPYVRVRPDARRSTSPWIRTHG
ncbi:hypothetical protein [Streptomyces sp. NBC_01451]|uniref:hypothetical protein n=1 Tax=Streptomyces sp. NBC_01451 TaxID=2903872 RepID=UPI002E2EE432|nr:hypothetical protein [Streptomyces sp. NBC_01451]